MYCFVKQVFVKQLWDVLALNLIYLPRSVSFVSDPLPGAKSGKTAGMRSNTVQNVVAAIDQRPSLPIILKPQ
jgi:hypothetical protein